MLYNFAGALGRPVPDSSSPVAANSFTDMDWILFSSAGCAALYDEAETAMLRWALPPPSPRSSPCTSWPRCS